MSKKSWCYLSIRPGKRVKIDREDLEKASAHSWRVTFGTTGRPRVVTSIRGASGVKNITLGRFLMKPPRGKQVYPRRFNDGLDYRKSNLIVCSVKERQRLLPKRRAQTSSKFRGVSYSARERMWKAAIEVDGVSINLGLFKTQVEAARRYNRAAREHFGLLAYQNPTGKRSYKRRRI